MSLDTDGAERPARAAGNNRGIARGNLRIFPGVHERRTRPGLGRRREIPAFILALGLPPLLQFLDLLPHDHLSTDMLVHLKGIVGVALLGGLWPAVLAAVFAGLIVNYFSVRPVGSLSVIDPENVLALLIFVLVAVAMSEDSISSSASARTGVLAEQGITIRDGLFVGDDTFSPYDGEPGTTIALPVKSTQTSAINAEFIYRGSFIEPTDRITIPTTSKEAAQAAEHHMETIRTQPTGTALQQGRKLWADMLDSKTFPSDDDCHALIANLQFPAIRDRLIADIPGVDEPMQQILFAQTEAAPKRSRIEWAQQLLLHAYTLTSTEHATPFLTAIGYIQLVGRQRQQSPSIPSTRTRHRPRLPPRPSQRPNDPLRPRRRLENEQKHRLQTLPFDLP